MKRRTIPGAVTTAKIGSSSRTYFTLGRMKKMSDKRDAILEYLSAAQRTVYSGAPPTVNIAFANTTAGESFLEYIQASAGVDYTNSTAQSGCQAVFATNLANTVQAYSGTNSWYSQLPNPVSATGGNVSSQTFVINKVQCETKVTNTTNILIEMKIYDIVCRNDLAAGTPSVLSLWQNGLYYEGSNSTQRAFMWSLKGTPFDSQQFTQYMRVARVHTVTLEPGATHTHVHTHNLHRSVYPVRFKTTTAFVEGLNSGTIFVATGQPVEATLSPNIGAVTTGIVDLNVVAEYKAELAQRYVNKKVFQSSAEPLLVATQAVGGFKVMSNTNLSFTTQIEGG